MYRSHFKFFTHAQMTVVLSKDSRDILYVKCGLFLSFSLNSIKQYQLIKENYLRWEDFPPHT